MKSRNRILSGILSCLTCLGSMGSAAKYKPAASPAGEARRKNGRKKRRNRNANKRADISSGIDAGTARNGDVVSGTGTNSPGSGLSGRDIGFLAGGAIGGGTLLGIGGYFLGKKLGDGTKISDVVLDKIVSSCSRNLDKKRFLSFIEAIAHAKTTITGSNEVGDVFDVDITFDKNFDAEKLGKLSFHIEYHKLGDEIAKAAPMMVEQYKVEFKVGEELCFCDERENISSLDLGQQKFAVMFLGLVLAILRRFFPVEVSDKLSGIANSHPGVAQSLGLLANILSQGLEEPSGE